MHGFTTPTGYPTAPFCGPDVPTDSATPPDRCADWRTRATPDRRTTEIVCEGRQTVDGATVLCSHSCHGLPDKVSRPAGIDHRP